MKTRMICFKLILYFTVIYRSTFIQCADQQLDGLDENVKKIYERFIPFYEDSASSGEDARAERRFIKEALRIHNKIEYLLKKTAELKHQARKYALDEIAESCEKLEKSCNVVMNTEEPFETVVKTQPLFKDYQSLIVSFNALECSKKPQVRDELEAVREAMNELRNPSKDPRIPVAYSFSYLQKFRANLKRKMQEILRFVVNFRPEDHPFDYKDHVKDYNERFNDAKLDFEELLEDFRQSGEDTAEIESQFRDLEQRFVQFSADVEEYSKLPEDAEDVVQLGDLTELDTNQIRLVLSRTRTFGPNYTISRSDGTVTYTFSPLVNCSEVRYAGNTVWKYDSSQHNGQYPYSVHVVPKAVDITISFSDRGFLRYKYVKQKGFKLFSEFPTPYQVAFYAPGTDNEMERLGQDMYEVSRTQKTLYLYKFKPGAVCHEVRLGCKVIWKAGDRNIVGYPESVEFGVYSKVCIINFTDDLYSRYAYDIESDRFEFRYSNKAPVKPQPVPQPQPQPSTPVQPEPTQPGESKPIQPVPIEPSISTEPTLPSQPMEPPIPIPTEPSLPTDPSEPSVPIEPSTPSESRPTHPGEVVEPGEVVRPSEDKGKGDSERHIRGDPSEPKPKPSGSEPAKKKPLSRKMLIFIIICAVVLVLLLVCLLVFIFKK